MKSKKKIKIYFYVFILISLFIFFTFVHEFSHIIVGLFSGNKLKDIVFIPVRENMIFLGLGITWEYLNYDYYWFQIIAGSLGSITISSFLLFLSIKKKNIIILSVCFTNIFYELSYWCLGTFLTIGDPYNLFLYFDLQNIYYNPIFFFVGFLFLSVLMFSLFIFTLYKVWRFKEIERYGK